jgi:hypothetical protein
LVLRLGPSKPLVTDHVLLVVDRSQSGSSALPRDSARMFAQLLDTLPPGTTFDAITFAREAESLLDRTRFKAGQAPRADDAAARAELERSLQVTVTGQGTDLRAAMAMAGEQLAARKAKQPLVLVVTDGMLPPSIGAEAIAGALDDALGKAARPAVLFVVDDPLLNRRSPTPLTSPERPGGAPRQTRRCAPARAPPGDRRDLQNDGLSRFGAGAGLIPDHAGQRPDLREVALSRARMQHSRSPDGRRR